MISPALLFSLGLVSTASATCTRGFLQDGTANYLKAIGAGQSTLLALSSNAIYLENDIRLDITKGVLAKPIKVDFSRSILDTTQCAIFTELAATSDHPYVIHTHIWYANDKISAIDSVVSDEGDWIFNATTFLNWSKQENWDPIPAEKRNTRAVIQAAGDAYLDQWGNVSHPVPLGTPCTRLEGGLYTGSRNASANTCPMGAFPQPLNVGNRRYVIDEEFGSVSILNDFPFLEKTFPVEKGTPSSNLFRVEGGLIRYIHEVTVCATKNCGR